MSHKIAKAFTQLSTGIAESPVVRRALFEQVAEQFGEWGNGWAAPSGSSIKTTFNADESTTVSNPPTQAEVQAINDRLRETRRLLKAIIETVFTD